ncbi:MAG: shikimate dehydrogenase, partial [Ignavibacteriae bacterium]|nr:shikimate dehydrogenase [Ignavibacteriota bacterium]
MAKENVEIFQSSNLIINTTSIGMLPNVDDTPTDFDAAFNNSQIVFDLVYNPIKTKFLKLAESKGATVLDGLKMFVVQGAKSFELWT